MIRGCVSVDMIYGKYRKGYEIYKNLKDLENYILSKNPELSSKVGKGKELNTITKQLLIKNQKIKTGRNFTIGGKVKLEKNRFLLF